MFSVDGPSPVTVKRRPGEGLEGEEENVSN